MIYFVTVNYQSGQLIENLVRSISVNIESPYEILIVNNSPEESLMRYLDENHITIIEAGENLGFGQACNLGISSVYALHKSALIWLINPDAVLDNQADVYVLNCFEADPGIAILGTQIRNSEGDVWFALGIFNRWLGYVGHATSTKAVSTIDQTTSTSWVSGCSMIINLSQFATCPSFDASYFLYYEDVDFCVRLSREGHEIAVTRDGLVTHQVSSIIGRDTSFMFRHYTFGRLTFLRRHATYLGFLLYVGYLVCKIALLWLTDFASAQGRWQGLRCFLKNERPGKP